MFCPRPVTGLILLIALLATAGPVTAQVSCTPVFIKEFAGTGALEPRAIKALPDGNILIAGRATADAATTTYDGYISKQNAFGIPLWTFRIGGPGDDAFTGVTPLSDGGAILFGSTASFGHPEGKAWIVRIDAAGALLWSRQLGSGSTGPDRMKAVLQYSNGDLIGSFNTGDSSSASNPVVFRMALDGTLLWAHTFDNGDNDSFTSIAFAGNTIYAAGFYTAGSRHAVIVQLNAPDGAYIASKNIYRDDDYNQEITGLEVANNMISYGLWEIKDNAPFGYLNGLVLVQTDLSDNPILTVYTGEGGDASMLIPHRTADDGFIVLKPLHGVAGGSSVCKVNHYGQADWGNQLGQYYIDQTNYALDITPDGGCISAGYYNNYLTGNLNIMNIIKMNGAGQTGGCMPPGNVLFTDTLGYQGQPFSWNNQSPFSPALNETVTPTSTPFTHLITTPCYASLCTDHTPLPPGCGKTYRIEYSSDKLSIFRDVAPTTDGGRIAIGNMQNDGLAVKFNINGDIAWSKTYEKYFHGLLFTRIIRTPDDNLLIFANNYVTVNHGAYGDVMMLKMDNNGNILWSREILPGYEYMQVADVTPAPDNGFVIVCNDDYGSGGTFTFVARYDANANMIWKKELLHNPGTPIYRSATCSPDGVFLAYDYFYVYNNGKYGVDKLDLATGNAVWNKSYLNPVDGVVLNKICVINDTVYTFLTRSVSLGFFSSVQNTLIAKIDQQGNLFQSLYLTDNNLIPSQTYNYFDAAPPIVTMTPSFDFVMCNRVAIGTDTMLNLTRFGQDGRKQWSRNFPGISSYTPYNIHPQGTGFIITGTATTPRPGYPTFTNGFLLKVDSNGEITPNATGDCAQIPSTPSLSPANNTSTSPAISGVGDWKYFSTPPASLSSQPVSMDATAFCQTLTGCGIVGFRQKGMGCSLADTLVYYLQDAANCDAAATWSYDASFLRPGVVNGDSIELIPLRTGLSTVTANIEGNCSLSIQQLPASILVSASQVSLGNDTILCKGSIITLSPGNGYATYTWNDNSSGPTLAATGPGKYYVDVKDNCGGSGADTIMVTLADSLFHLKGDTASCNGAPIQLLADAGYQNYQWSPSGNIQTQNNTAVVTPDVTTLYQVIAQNATGCSVTAIHLINALSSPPIFLGKDTSICTGDSVLLDAGPAFSHYRWSSGDTTQQTYAKKPGTFIIAALYANGCFSNDTFQLISLYKNPIPSLDKNPVLCLGGDRLLDPGNSYTQYLWNDGSVAPTLLVSQTGSYWVTVTDQHRCIGADTVHILSTEPPPSDFLPQDTTICQYGDLKIRTHTPFADYQWSDLSSGPVLTLSHPGLYWVTVKDGNGCTGKDSVLVTQKECLVGLFVPNAWTPNGNGHNDLFRPLLYGNVAQYYFAVFGRWGEKLFESHQPMQGWDGTIRGASAPAGTYVWYCQYQLDGQPLKMDKGTVILIR